MKKSSLAPLIPIPLAVETTAPGTVPTADTSRTQPAGGTPDISLIVAAADATTVPMPKGTAFNPQAVQLLFSRRFNSSRALARIADPSAEDKIILSRLPPSVSRASHLFGSVGNLILVAMISISMLGALLIAFF